MKQLCFIIIVLAVIVVPGCDKTNRLAGLDDPEWNRNVYELAGEVLRIDTTLMNVWGLLRVDDLLFIHQGLSAHEYSVYREQGDSLLFIDHLIRRGNGPTEVNRGRLYYLPENNALVAVAYNVYGKIISIPYDDIFNERSWNVSQNNSLVSASEIIPMDTENFLVRNILDDSIFATYGIGDNALRNLSLKYPASSSALSPAERSTYIYDVFSHKRPGGNRFAYSRSYGHFVQIFELNGDRVDNIKTLFGEEPQYIVSGGRASVSGMTKSGLRMFVSGKYIYLCNERIRHNRRDEDAKRNGFPASYAKEIYVCDWEGNPVRKYVLDRPVGYCTVDQLDKYLYATVYDENLSDEIIVRFRLPD